MESIKINIDTDTRSLADMKRELRDIKAEMVGVSDPTQFAELATKAAELETEFRRVNSAVAELSASGDELPRMSKALGGIGGSLARLDFSAANEGAGRLLQISQQMTFKTAITGIKNLGSTFINLGKALLTNPLFLLAAVIAAIAVGIYKLLDSLGLIKKMFDIISDAIGWVIQLLKDLLDWLGLTSFAEDEAAERATVREENLRRQRERAYNERIGNMAHEIEMMKIQGASIEEIEEAELELARTKAKTAKEALRAQEQELQYLLKIGQVMGMNTEEIENQLFALQDTAKKAEQELEKLEARIEKNREDRANKSEEDEKQRAKRIADARKKIAEDTEKFLTKLERDREDLKISQMLDEIEREEKQALTRLKRQQEDIDFSKMAPEAKVQWDLWYQSEVERIENEALTKKQKREHEAQEKLEEMREAFQLSIQEKIEKSEEELRQEKFDKEMEDLQKLLDAKAISEEEYDEMRLARENKLKEDLLDLEEKRLDEEDKLRKAAQKSAVDSGVDMFNKLAMLSAEGSAVQKASALVSIIAAQAESLAKAVPVALEASKGTGPGAPFVFGATLAGIIGSIGASIASAKSVLQSAPGPSPSGGGGGGSVIGGVASVTSQSQTPQFNLFGQANQTGGDTSQFDSVDRDNGSQTIRAVVSWTDIDAVTNSNNTLQQEMQL